MAMGWPSPLTSAFVWEVYQVGLDLHGHGDTAVRKRAAAVKAGS